MNREEAKQLLPIIQAYSEGKEIEELAVFNADWVPIGPDPLFHHAARYYRIKPEPIECWAVVTGHGLIPYDSQLDAECYARCRPGYRVIRMREV